MPGCTVRKFGVSCKNHIINGICLPATTALGEKITYRTNESTEVQTLGVIRIQL